MSLLLRSLSAPRPAVYPQDPALDIPEKDRAGIWDEWTRTRDLSALRPYVLPDAELTVCMVRSLTPAEARRIGGLLDFGAQQWETCLLGCTGISGLQNEATGKAVSLEQANGRMPADFERLLVDDTFRHWLWLEIKEAGRLHPEQRKSHRVPVVDDRPGD